MPEDYGADDYGEDVYGGALERIIVSEFIEYWPEILPRELNTTFRQYIEAADLEYEGLDAASSYVRQSHSVNDATGRDLERIGAIFGTLGRKGTRTEDEYRTYLKSIINSFNARGTLPGLKFAIASAANTDTSNIVVQEDFVENEYSVQIRDTEAQFVSGVVNDLAELADPSGIELTGTPVIFTEGDQLLLDRTDPIIVESKKGLGADTLTLDGQSQLQ